MESAIAKALDLRHMPVAISLNDSRPSNAKQFKEGKWGCVMFMLGAAAKGAAAVFDENTYGCWGGGVGLGFGDQYENFPGGKQCFCHFLSVGNEVWEEGRKACEMVKPYMGEAYDDFVHGERYLKDPEAVADFIESLPITRIRERYVVFRPVSDVNPEQERPEIIVFLADMDQISGLSILANHERKGNENVIFPYAAGCQSIGIYPLREARSEHPRAVLGLNDISARVALKRILKDDVMSFAVPMTLYEEMERNVPGSFLERPTWKRLMAVKTGKTR